MSIPFKLFLEMRTSTDVVPVLVKSIDRASVTFVLSAVEY